MDELIIDTIIDKVNAGEKRLDANEKLIADMDKKLYGSKDQSANQKQILELIKQLQEGMKEVKWPVKEIAEMSFRLRQNNDFLANPKKTKQVVFHTAGKLAWIITGLFIVIISLVIQLLNISNNLDQYKMNDLMWRYIKLSNNSQNLEYLQSVERMYLTSPEKMKILVEKEELSLKQIAESEINKPGHSEADTTPGLNKKRK